MAVRLTAPAGVMLAAEDQPESNVVFAFGDRAVRVAAPALEAFLAVVDCRPWAVADLPPVGAEEDRRAEFARMLVSTGMATVDRLPGR